MPPRKGKGQSSEPGNVRETKRSRERSKGGLEDFLSRSAAKRPKKSGEEPAPYEPSCSPEEAHIDIVGPSAPFDSYEPREIGKGIDGMKIVSWNVNGIRAALGHSFESYVKKELPDVLCLQETKVNADTRPPLDFAKELGYFIYFSHCSTKKGYSGTCVLSLNSPSRVFYGMSMDPKDREPEGRIITLDFGAFFLVNTYVPNSGRGLLRLKERTTSWDVNLQRFLRVLESERPVLWVGDLNVAHKNIDIAVPSRNLRSAGFTVEERIKFGEFLALGWVDTFRSKYPMSQAFTYFSYVTGARSRNIGWRLDYMIASPSLVPKIVDVFCQQQVLGSDHCPIGVIVDVELSGQKEFVAFRKCRRGDVVLNSG